MHKYQYIQHHLHEYFTTHYTCLSNHRSSQGTQTQTQTVSLHEHGNLIPKYIGA